MNNTERQRIQDIVVRLQDVVGFLDDNDPENLSGEDIDSLRLLLVNISGALEDLTKEPESGA